MNYDTMTAHDLVLELQESMRQAVIKWKPVNLNQRTELEAALRSKVIEEASVGKVSIKQRAIDGFPLIDGLTITRCEDLSAWTAYDLIPKETP